MVFNILSKFNISNGNRYITDGNDILQYTAQIYNERTSTDLNTLRTRSFQLFKRPFPGFLTILTL